MNFDDDDSSIDGSLTDILTRGQDYDNTLADSLGVGARNVTAVLSTVRQDGPSNGLQEYIPSCMKLTELLSQYGFVVKLSMSDIDEKSRYVCFVML